MKLMELIRLIESYKKCDITFSIRYSPELDNIILKITYYDNRNRKTYNKQFLFDTKFLSPINEDDYIGRMIMYQLHDLRYYIEQCQQLEYDKLQKDDKDE